MLSPVVCYLIIWAIIKIAKLIRKANRSDPALTPKVGLRILKRLRRHKYAPVYRGLTYGQRTFMKVVRNLHRVACTKHGVSEEHFYRFLCETVKCTRDINQLNYRGDQVVALLQAVEFWAEHRHTAWMMWKPGTCNHLDEVFADLVNHLFQVYEVPPALVSIWWRWEEPEMKDFCERFTKSGYRDGVNSALFDLYFGLTQGGSLRQHRELRFPISRRIATFYMESSVRMRFDQAYWWCVYMAAGGQKNHSWTIQNTTFDFGQREFWSSFLRWLAQTERACQFDTNYLLPRLVTRIELVCFGSGRLAEQKAYAPFANLKPTIKLAGQTPASLWRRLDRLVRPAFPLPSGLRNAYVLRQEADELLCIVRLKNSAELEEEGQIMGHCVGDGEYVQGCLDGEVSIWSLRREQQGAPTEHLLTVEVADNYIEEMGGPRGTGVAEEYYALVQKWVEEHFKN